VASTDKDKQKYWLAWQAYAESLGVDPYLPRDITDRRGYIDGIRALGGFAGRCKTGYYGFGREVQSGTVSKAFTAISQAISMDCGYNPLKMNGTDKLLHPLQRILDGFKKWDKPTTKKLPVEVGLVELLCTLGQMGLASTKDAVLGDWAMIAFYYLLRVGEYTQKGTRNASKQTVEFRMKDVTFFYHDEKKRLRQMPRNATDEVVMNAAGATLRLSNQKNGWKNACIFHFHNGEPINSPVRTLGRRFIHIRAHCKDDTTPLSTFFVQGCRHNLRDNDVRRGVKMAAATLNYPELCGIPIDKVDTHSLRAGGANALHLAGYSDTEIQKMGRWRSDTFKEYITEGLAVFSTGMSTKMQKKHFQFVNVQGGVDSDVVNVTSSLVHSPYDMGAAAA